jgi:hypothetical protein
LQEHAGQALALAGVNAVYVGTELLSPKADAELIMSLLRDGWRVAKKLSTSGKWVQVFKRGSGAAAEELTEAGLKRYKAAKKPVFGEKGVQTPSKTVWKGKGKERIDIENPNPGQRPGQIHYQDNQNNKYLYDPTTDSFPGAPKQVNDLLKVTDFRKGIEKALRFLGEGK